MDEDTNLHGKGKGLEKDTKRYAGEIENNILTIADPKRRRISSEEEISNKDGTVIMTEYYSQYISKNFGETSDGYQARREL